MCSKTGNKYLFVFDSIPDQYKTQEMRTSVVSQDPFLIVYCPSKYITQNMCDKAVYCSLATLKFLLIGLLQVKWLKDFLLLCMQMKIYSILLTIPVILYLIVMKL